MQLTEFRCHFPVEQIRDIELVGGCFRDSLNRLHVFVSDRQEPKSLIAMMLSPFEGPDVPEPVSSIVLPPFQESLR